MKKVYGYIRVSTKEQIDGASLPEQKNAIKEFAKKNDLKIIHFYEETKTAAKKGRPFFLEMIENLNNGKADGVIIHKIDRSARNLHDWASIGDLIDRGIEVFFAHESLDMNERGGRLSADIQAVMASDYVRNLRQEILKGLYGRLKQGFYPWCAPIGYINNGRAEIKTLDPIQSVLILKLFELYVTGNHNVLELSKEMENQGLRNKKGKRVCKNGIVRILKNPFYIGIIKIKGKVFKGNHKAIIDTRLFEQVQKVLKGRNKNKGLKHFYLFRKLIRCHHCNYIMSGELQKGHVYYRCKTKTCDTKCIREDIVEGYVKNILKTIKLNNTEVIILDKILVSEKDNCIEIKNKMLNGYSLNMRQLKDREQKLLDAYLDNVIEKEEFQKRKEKILLELRKMEEQKASIEASTEGVFDTISKLVELCKSPLNTYAFGIQEEKRELLEIISSNLTIDRRKAIFTMVSPFFELANRDSLSLCEPERDINRTMYRNIIYTDKNTSPIIPKPLKKKQLKQFFDFLLKIAPSLHIQNDSEYNYEIPTNNTDS